MSSFNESVVEQAALEWFADLVYQTLYGPNISPGGDRLQLRDRFEDVVLIDRLLPTVRGLNKGVDRDIVEKAVAQLLRSEHQNPVDENHRIHKLVIEGVPVEHRGSDGQLRTVRVRLIDFDEPTMNDWVALNQFTVAKDGKSRRPDVLVFVNGLPLALFEWKNPADENADMKGAWNQVQTYRTDIPAIFDFNAVTVISDGVASAAMG